MKTELNKNAQKTTKNLRFGDLIEVDWLDASEATGSLESGKFDTPVRSVGYFLGIKGRKTKHLVIAKELVRTCDAFHYNVIPVGMIENIRTLAHEALDLDNIKVLKKCVRTFMQRLREKDGWIYFEEPTKKTIG
jgi:hypothetical protein